ncbi:MAG: hypothetical protein NC132_03135 [Corallococcus sp.]|nr:hypothetical protein [Corallococcus sp.]MCM1359101.1 hypothetical protein [Corallococcus sp.]MCM1395090.1 hypothetical protein [Corallococcus sp.]
MIRLIYGIPGAGKTALMAALCIEDMYGENAVAAITGAYDEVAMLNQLGFKVTPPKSDHLVYCSKLTIDVTSPDFGHRRSLETSVDRLGVGSKNFTPQYFYRGSTIALDELPEDADSREWTSFPAEKRRFFAKHRKRNLTIYATCQDPEQCEKRFRKLALITHVREIEFIYNEFDEVIQTVWTLQNWKCYEDWETKVTPTEETYVYNGDIREAYDTYEGEEEFYIGLENSDFSCEYSRYKKLTPQGIAEYAKKYA